MKYNNIMHSTNRTASYDMGDCTMTVYIKMHYLHNGKTVKTKTFLVYKGPAYAIQ